MNLFNSRVKKCITLFGNITLFNNINSTHRIHQINIYTRHIPSVRSIHSRSCLLMVSISDHSYDWIPYNDQATYPIKYTVYNKGKESGVKTTSLPAQVLVLPAPSVVSSREEYSQVCEQLVSSGSFECTVVDWPGMGTSIKTTNNREDVPDIVAYKPKFFLNFLLDFLCYRYSTKEQKNESDVIFEGETKSLPNIKLHIIGGGHSITFITVLNELYPKIIKRCIFLNPTIRSPLRTVIPYYLHWLLLPIIRFFVQTKIGFRIFLSKSRIEKNLRNHVYYNQQFITSQLIDNKFSIATYSINKRFMDAAYITGKMDLCREFEDFNNLTVSLNRDNQGNILNNLIIIGDQAAKRSLATMKRMSEETGFMSVYVEGKLLLHEEEPEKIANIIYEYLTNGTTIQSSSTSVNPSLT